MITICKMLGGSRGYGLNMSEDSDIDILGVYLTDDPLEIFGVKESKTLTQKTQQQDVVMYELRHFLKLLEKGSSQCLELLFADKYIEATPLMRFIFQNRNYLIDSVKIEYSLRGCGNACMAQIPSLVEEGNQAHAVKTFVQSSRLLHCGICLFLHGIYPVDFNSFNVQLATYWRELRSQPNKINLYQMQEAYQEDLALFDAAVKQAKFKFEVKPEVVQSVCLKAYVGVLHYQAGISFPQLKGNF